MCCSLVKPRAGWLSLAESSTPSKSSSARNWWGFLLYGLALLVVIASLLRLVAAPLYGRSLNYTMFGGTASHGRWREPDGSGSEFYPGNDHVILLWPEA